MPDLPDLPTLAASVAGDTPLERIAAAEEIATQLTTLGDRLIGLHVEQARTAGYSWTDIGAHLGVSRQAAQQRYTPRWASLTLADLRRAGALDRLTPRTVTALEQAERHAHRLGAPAIGPEHLLLAILDNAQTLGARAISALVGDPARLRAALDVSAGGPLAAEPPLGPAARRALEGALAEALDLGHNYIGTEHLLLGVLRDPRGPLTALLGEHGMTPAATKEAVAQLIAEVLRGR